MGMISIWDGKDLPPIGCDVHYEVGSAPGAFVGKVKGYTIAAPLDRVKNQHHHRVFVDMECKGDGGSPYPMQRMLDDIHPLTWRPD